MYLNIGFTRNQSSYDISEASALGTIIDRLKIEYDTFSWLIDDQTDNLFFYMINDTNVPFMIDQNSRDLLLINNLDREQQNEYVFEIQLKFKSIYATKLQAEHDCQRKSLSTIDFQYTGTYYQTMLVIIRVQDVNDNVPICVDAHVHRSLNENQVQHNVFHVQAYDPDRGSI
jgi:hypothetical protein